mgnify:CR=1 FL=1
MITPSDLKKIETFYELNPNHQRVFRHRLVRKCLQFQKDLEVIMLNSRALKIDIEKIWTLDDYIEWLKRIINNEKDRVILIGHSNGGRIALNFAIKY